MFPTCHTRERGAEQQKSLRDSMKRKPCKKMGCGENKLMMAQHVQEAVRKIRKEDRELPWLGAAAMQYHYLQKNNIGIGS